MAEATARSSSILLQGSVISGRYQVLRVIGIGSMGTVYVCKAVKNPKKLVAMKVLNPSGTGGKFDQNFLARFEREVAVAQVVQHPNVVSLVDVISGEDLAAHVLEYVPGGDLSAYIRLNHPLPYGQVGRILSEICGGCQAIHDAAIIHRDLKPENILLTENNTAKISDFGLARITGGPNLTAKGGVVGTIRYLSPEYIESGTVSPLGDIHAIGLLGYEMVTGKSPYAGLTFYETIEKKVQEDLTPLSEVVPTCPPDFARIIDKACSRRPSDRYQSAQAMQGAILDILPSLSLDRDPSRLTLSRSAKSHPLARKKRSPLVLAAMGILAGFVTVLGAVLLSEHAKLPQLQLRTPIAAVAPESLGPEAGQNELVGAVLEAPVGPVGPEIPAAPGSIDSAPAARSASPAVEEATNLLTATQQVVPPLELLLPQAAELEKPIKQPVRTKPLGKDATLDRPVVPAKTVEKTEAPRAAPLSPARIESKPVNSGAKVAPAAVEPHPEPQEVEDIPEIPASSPAPELERGPEPSAEYKVRGTLLYRFADYVKWPATSYSGSEHPFRICIVGKDPFGRFLDSQVSRTQTRQGRSFAISRFANTPSPEVLRLCQLAYVSEDATRAARQTLRQLRGFPVLVVTEDTDYGMINFVIDEGKVKFAVNRGLAENAGLGIGSVLLDLAVEVVD